MDISLDIHIVASFGYRQREARTALDRSARMSTCSQSPVEKWRRWSEQQPGQTVSALSVAYLAPCKREQSSNAATVKCVHDLVPPPQVESRRFANKKLT